MNTQRVEGHTPTLKPCPFCGKQPTLTHMPVELYNGCIPTRDHPSWMIKCSFLWCPGSSPSAHSRSSEQDAIEKWNSRAPSIERLEKVNEALVRALEACESVITNGVHTYHEADDAAKDARAALSLAKEPA